MFRITPYNKTLRSDQRGYRDVFDLFDDFFAERDYGYRKFKLDVRDTNDTYIIDADLPGIKKEDISIHFEDEQLVIAVNREENNEEENNDYIHRERSVSSFERRINLRDVDPSKFKASLKDGVLTIHAPKLEEKVNKYMIDIE
jgi:HSP20 family protein